MASNELKRLSRIKEADPGVDLYAELYDSIVNKNACVEINVDVLPDNGAVKDFDALCAELGP